MRKTIFIGKQSSAVASVVAVLYAVLQILFGLEIIPYPGNLYWFFAPCLLLSFVFLVTTVCLDILIPDKYRLWTIASWTIATINLTMIIMLYFFHEGVLNPAHLNWQNGELASQVFEKRTMLVGVLYAGFFLLATSAFILAFAFRNFDGKRFFCGFLINAVLLPLLVISYLYPKYYYLASVWMITFPLASFYAHKFFIMQERKLNNKVTDSLKWIIE